MSNLRKVVERIIEAHDNIGIEAVCDAVDDAKKLLAEQPQQEPYGYLIEYANGDTSFSQRRITKSMVAPNADIVPLYIHPHAMRRLSDFEVNKLWVSQYGVRFDSLSDLHKFANAIMDACNIPKEGE